MVYMSRASSAKWELLFAEGRWDVVVDIGVPRKLLDEIEARHRTG